MKLKKCILAGVLAASMLCESLFGVAITAPVQVYADEVDNTGAEQYENVALNKAVKTSSVDKTETGIVGANAVDGDENTKWTSVELSSESPQWLQIDLGDKSTRTTVDRIEIKFAGAAWNQGYTIETYDSESNTSRHTVKTVGNSGPAAGEGENPEGRSELTDTISRNNDNEKIILRRYVRFAFAGTGATKVSVAEIKILGTNTVSVHGPSVTMVAPTAGAYPKPAEVAAPAQDVGVYHKVLADRATPAATLIKKGTGTQETENRTVGADNTPTTAPIWKNGEVMGELENSQVFVKDGTYGFNAAVQTPGTLNKFDVWGTDVKVVSFQLYLKRLPSGTKSIFGKGNKYAMQVTNNKLLIFMNSKTGNGWPEQSVAINQSFVGKWLDVLMVVDGKDRQRLYVDGKASTTDRPEGATAVEVPNKGLKPFTLGYNLADDNVDGQSFTADDGYIARFKFYTNADRNGVTNSAGTDISDAKQLSDEADELINITDLESKVSNRDEVYNIITNQIQKEDPAVRISLCPYSRSTVWQKKGNDGWTDLAATEKFAADTKYRAVTRLIADDGFIFDQNSIDSVKANLSDGTNDQSAKTTVAISNKERELTIKVYYNCDDADVEETCHIDDILIENDPVHMKVGDTVSLGAEATGIGRCAAHSSSTLKYTYTLPENEERVTVDETGTLTAVSATKGVLGYDPLSITVTAALMDGDNPVMAGSQEVKVTRTVRIYVDPADAEDEEITVAPVVTAHAPVAGEFPQVVDIAMPDNAKHFNDIADRMNPGATLEPLTKDYIQNSNYIKTDASSNNNRPAQPDSTWLQGWDADADKPQAEQKYSSIIENVDGVMGFNGIGQTPGDTNKFDVFGEDIKLVSFKLYLKKWPANPYNVTKDDGATLDIYGKGRKYAMQVTSTKRLIMYMENRNGGWPQETFQADDSFLNKWHNIFMVVDGKGWQRLYVDGKRSTSRSNQGDAYAREVTGDHRKPFTLGYNSTANHPSWYDGIFTNDYGYIADFEFYSDKNYDNVINGAGTDISEAQVLDEEMTEIIDLEELERKYANNLDDIGTILTNLLQTRNATACITATPYVAKTNWSQKKEDGTFEDLDKVNAQKFGYSSNYRSVTTLTAYDGFKFKNDQAFTDAVAANFATEGDVQADSVTATVGPNAAGVANKVLTITAVYGKTAEAPCTCGIESISPQAPIDVEIPENASEATKDITPISTEAVKLVDCQKTGHPVMDDAQIKFTYSVADGDTDKIELIKNAQGAVTGVKALKAGTAKINVKAEYQLPTGADGAYETVTNDDGAKAEKTIQITVNVTKAGAASSTEKNELNGAASDAETNYPDSVEDDYQADAWQELQDAIADAKALAADSNATSTQVANAKKRIEDAIKALADAKSEKGLAKDALKAVLDDAALKALIDGNNSDKKYTADSFAKLTAAYADAESKLMTADAATLGTLKTTLEAAWRGLVPTPAGGGTGGSVIANGTVLTGADGTKYQVVSGKDKTVTITKGVDAKTVKVGPTVTIGKDTFKVVGIGNKAYTGLKKATKVIINANVETIGDQAFEKSKKIKNVTIGANVTKIGKKAFFNCPKLNKVTFKGTALTDKGVGSKAFAKTAKKSSVKWGKIKGKARTKLSKKLKKAGLKIK